MSTCLNGHSNPKGQRLCRECDALLVADSRPTTPWIRTALITTVAGVVVALVISATALATTFAQRERTVFAAADTGSIAVQQWWDTAGSHVTDLQAAMDDVRDAFDRFDKKRLERACERVHDGAVVGLQAYLPSPEPDLTSELEAAIQDAHSAAHLCLAAMAGSPTNYDAEFATYLDEADTHLKAARNLVGGPA